ncbi:MAG: multidrug effflux MFS transporter, partial [Actinomycetota bacterium]
MSTSTVRPRRLGRVEFTALLAMSMALAALGIDIVLPAFGDMRREFGLAADSTAVAGVITAYFIGLSVAQVVYGPLADRFGRKPILYAGYGMYLVGAVTSAFAPSLTLLYVARVIWGLGAAGPRVVTLSVVRDRFDGEEMSRAMSFIMAVFILVPILAPSLGAVVVGASSWRWVAGVCALLVGVMALWAIRLEESLDPAYRRDLKLSHVWEATLLVVTNRFTMSYTLALTALFGVFISYLGSSEIIFGEVFGMADEFPLIFGAVAAVMGGAMLANAFVVRRFGTRRMAHGVLVVYVLGAMAFLALAVGTSGRPPLGVFLVALMVMLSCHALLIPNFNTIAMDPMKEVAGTASAVIGTLSTAGGAV